MPTGIGAKAMGKDNDLSCVPALGRALHVLPKEGRKRSALIGTGNEALSGITKPLCRERLLSSCEYDKPLEVAATATVNPSPHTDVWRGGSVRKLGTTRCLFGMLLSQYIVDSWI